MQDTTAPHNPQSPDASGIGKLSMGDDMGEEALPQEHHSTVPPGEGAQLNPQKHHQRRRPFRSNLPDFSWAEGAVEMANPSPTVIALHDRTRFVREKKTSAHGIMPVCLDPVTKEAYLLLGRSFRWKWCHFHGWVEPGETAAMGAAREGFEESRGAFGDPVDLWRALVTPGLHQRSWCFFVSLGYLDAAQREVLCDQFATLPVTHSGMTETNRLRFFNMKSLRSHCLSGGRYYLRGLGKTEAIRDFVFDQLSDQEQWGEPFLQALVDEGRFVDGWRPLADLPPLSAEERAGVLWKIVATTRAML